VGHSHGYAPCPAGVPLKGPHDDHARSPRADRRARAAPCAGANGAHHSDHAAGRGALAAHPGAIQSGSTISGDTVHIVVVQTKPGYQPDPGHPGTGTVVAQVT
jgi:hypothetical protein